MNEPDRPMMHPVTRLMLILWLAGAFHFGYLAVLLYLRLASQPVG